MLLTKPQEETAREQRWCQEVVEERIAQEEEKLRCAAAQVNTHH
jgi:hypothetical protein